MKNCSVDMRRLKYIGDRNFKLFNSRKVENRMDDILSHQSQKEHIKDSQTFGRFQEDFHKRSTAHKGEGFNILIVTGSFERASAHYTADLAIAFKEQGHNVIVLSSGGELVKEIVQKGVQHHELKYLNKNNFYKILKVPRKIAKVIVAHNIEIIYTRSFFDALISWLALKYLPQKNKRRVHTILSGNGFRNRSKYNRWAYFLAGIFLNHCIDLVLPTCEAERVKLKRGGLCPDKAITVYNGVDLRKFDVKNSSRCLTSGNNVIKIGILARLSPEKGHRYFLEAAATVLKSFPKVQFWIVGEGPLKPKLEKMILKLGIREKIVFKKLPPNVMDILKDLDIVVLSSLREVFPFAILHAMAAAKPVVATAVGGVPEQLIDGETGFVVPPKDSNAIAQAIIRLLRDKTKAREMGVKGRKRVEQQFAIHLITQKIANVCERITSKTR